MKKLIISQFNGEDLIFDENGWFNVTIAAKLYGKKPIEWLRLADTQKYIDVLCNELNLSEQKLLIKTTRNSGTWVHPKLAIDFTRWLDVYLGVWCDRQIDKLLQKNHLDIDILKLRHQSAATYKLLARVLKKSRDIQGKITKEYHYQNETKLINWALTGNFSALNRDSLNINELDLLAELETQDMILIMSQCTYAQRKVALSFFAKKFKEERNNSCKRVKVLGDLK